MRAIVQLTWFQLSTSSPIEFFLLYCIAILTAPETIMPVQIEDYSTTQASELYENKPPMKLGTTRLAPIGASRSPPDSVAFCFNSPRNLSRH
jgi:hypothetical protein